MIDEELDTVNENNNSDLSLEKLPWLIVRLKQNYFCINCKYVRNIQMLPEKITPLPKSGKYVRGMFNLWGHVLPIIDLRTMMGMDTLDGYYRSITHQLDDLKEEHEEWIQLLCKAVMNDEPITVERDAHSCHFGKWYYNHISEHEIINRFLKKLEAPHEELHALTDEVDKKREELENASDETRELWKKDFVKNITNIYYANFQKAIIEVKDAIALAFKEMVVVIEDKHSSMALVVDEIISVDDVIDVKSQIDNPDFNSQGYLEGVVKCDNKEDEILKINIGRLIAEINSSMKMG